jgi:hypothetical protein
VRRRRLNSALPSAGRARGSRSSSGSSGSAARPYGSRSRWPRRWAASTPSSTRRGWRADGPTDILVAHDVVGASRGGVAVAVRPRVDRAWLDAWGAAESRAQAEETYAHALSRIPSPVAFAVFALDGRPAGIGSRSASAGGRACSAWRRIRRCGGARWRVRCWARSPIGRVNGALTGSTSRSSATTCRRRRGMRRWGSGARMATTSAARPEAAQDSISAERSRPDQLARRASGSARSPTAGARGCRARRSAASARTAAGRGR